MNKEELLEFRAKVAGQARQLALDGETDPASRLQLLLSLIRSGDASPEALNAVYDAVQQLPDATEKLDALLELLYEVDAQLTGEEDLANDEAEPGEVVAPEASGDADATY